MHKKVNITPQIFTRRTLSLPLQSGEETEVRKQNHGYVSVRAFMTGMLFFVLYLNALAQQTEIMFLSGRDAANPVEWEFTVTGGRKANIPGTIPVPSNWETEGYGTYNYGLDKNKGNEQGNYRYTFRIPESWDGTRIFIVFEGVMTDAKVTINGHIAGPVHQGGFYRFEYEITRLLRFGVDNLLEVSVRKTSANELVNAAERQADYWVFGGIYRPVYLKAVPNEYISRTAINAGANGRFQMDVYLDGVTGPGKIEGEIFQKNGTPLGGKFSAFIHQGDTFVRLQTQVTGHKTWNAESPVLYYAGVSLKRKGGIIHTLRQRFGFRTIEVKKGKGIFLNGERIILKGCNRHSFRPATGRALSRKDCYDDVMLLKEMNMNAVRMSHYPPDSWFLDYCDEYGIYVLDELAGWHKPPYDTPTGKRLVKEMLIRDVNHPSILFWDNGNEGGWNTAIDGEFARYDPQKRTVLHPWTLFHGIDTDHYESYESVQNKLKNGNIFMPTEHLHGLYDGGSGAGLDDFWKLMWGNPLTGGMFLWAFADEGIVRTDKNCIIDLDGNHAPDGILGPHHEKEASFFTIREVWSPIYIETDQKLPHDFDGTIPVENRYDFTSLDRCSFIWQLIRFPAPDEPATAKKTVAEGRISGPAIPPHQKGIIRIGLPPFRPQADALRLSALDMHGHEVCSWSWKLKDNPSIIKRMITTGETHPELINNNKYLEVQAGFITYFFDKESGLLNMVKAGEHSIPFGKGPLLVPSGAKKSHSRPVTSWYQTDTGLVVDVHHHPSFTKLRWTVFPGGWLRLDYSFVMEGRVDFLGITFSYPEEHVNGMRWLGKGPYRVWKNRLKGETFGVWEKRYNSFAPATAWDYPEFPGYYAQLSWVVFDTDDGPITIATDREDLFLRVYKQPDGKGPRHTAINWPDGDISLLHAIPAIGTKFHPPEELGPQGEKFKSSRPQSGTLYFYFGTPEMKKQ